MPRRTLTPAPAPAPTPAPVSGGLPSHIRRPGVISLDAYPQHKAYVESLPVDHPDIRGVYSLAYDAQNGSGDARALAQQTLAQTLPPEVPSNTAYFGQVPNAPQTVSPTNEYSIPRTPSTLENLSQLGDVVNTNLDAGLMQGGRAMAAGLGMDPVALRRDAELSQPFVDKYSSMVAPNPVAQTISDVAGGGAYFGGAMAPYMNPAFGAVAGGGQAVLDNKSGVGIGLNALLGGVPGAAMGKTAQGIQQLTRAPSAVAHGVAGLGLGAGMTAATAGETYLLEDNPELAAQEAGMIAPSGAAMGAMGMGLNALTRGRAGFTPAPRPLKPPGADLPVSPEVFQTEPGGAGHGFEPVPDVPGQFRTQLPPDAAPVGPNKFSPPTEPELPAITRGEFHQTGSRPTTAGPYDLPEGRPGEFVPTGNATDAQGLPSIRRGDEVSVMRTPREDVVIPAEDIGMGRVDEDGMPYITPGFRTNERPRPVREGGYYKAEPGEQQGFHRMDAAPPTLEGFYGAVPKPPRKPDYSVGEQDFRDTTATGQDPVVLDRTHTGSDLSPVDAPEPYVRRTDGSIRGKQTPEQDPYGDVDGLSRVADPDAPTGEFDVPEAVRQDNRGVDNHYADDLPPFDAEGQQTFTPARRPDVEPRFQTTAERPPVRIRPGERTLSPEAQEFISGLKPGQRAAIKDTIEHRVRDSGRDPDGDLGNLQWAHQIAEGNAAKTIKTGKSQQRPKGEPPERGRTGDQYARPNLETRDSVPSGRPDRASGEPSPRVDSPDDLPPQVNYSGPSLAGAIKAAKGLSEAFTASGLKRNTIDLWSKRLYQVVGDLPGGKAAAVKARATLDRARSLMGEFEADRARFYSAIRGRTPAAKATRKSFEEVTWDGNTGFARIQQLFDKKVPPRAHEAAAINAYARAFLDTGKAAQAAGYQIRVGTKMVNFTADPNRLRAPRVGTRDMHWLAQRPDDAWTKALADDIAALNPGMTAKQILNELDNWGERGIAKRGLAEDARSIENFPTHWKTPDGQVIQLLETDPSRLIDAVTQRFPARIAYVENFGQGGIPPEFKELMGQSGDVGKQAGQNLFRALNGMPLDAVGGSAARPGSFASLVQRSASIPWSMYKGAKLQLAPLANLPETVGKARAIAGGNPLKFIKAGFDVSFLNKNSGAVLDDLAKRGAFTRDVMDWYWNKSDIPETLNRYVINTTSAVNRAVNEFNERLSARMSQMWSESLKAGKGGPIDKMRLKVLDFTDTEIEAILKGKASPAQYDAVIGRATEWAQASTSQTAERSRAGGTKWWNTITIADRFAQMNINRNFGAMSKAIKVAADGNSTWKDRMGAVAFATDLTAGQMSAAATTLILRAAVVGGAGVLTDKAFGSPVGLADFLSEAATYALLGGPIQSVVGAASQDRGNSVAESLGSTILPVGAVQEAVDAFHGTGRYQDMATIEKATTFLKSSQPLTSVAVNVMGTVGLADNNPKLNGAIREFWKWRENYAPTSRTIPAPGETDAFRSNMRKAAKAIQAGSDPAEFVREALGERDATSFAASLRKRKLVSNLKPEQQKHLTEYLGEATVLELRNYDNLLEAWAAAIKPKKR